MRPMSATGFRIGYATSGFSSHRLEDALDVLARLGYGGVSLTLDVQHLDPFAPDLAARVAHIRARLDRLGLSVVVETGARFILDPMRKHHPTLLSREGSERRREFLCLAIDVARDLGAEGVSLWAGARPADMSDGEAWDRLLIGLDQVLDHGSRAGVRVGLEPEPGMLVDTVAGWRRLAERLGGRERLGLSLDIGHLLVNGEAEPADVIRAEAPHLVTVAIEDMKRGIHEHLPFGEGDLDLPTTLAALRDCGYGGLVAVELARHGHDAVRVATACREVLAKHGVSFRGRSTHS